MLAVLVIQSAASGMYIPAVNSFSLGLVGKDGFPKRCTRNEMFRHGGVLMASERGGNISRVGIFLDFVRRSGTARAEGPHGATRAGSQKESDRPPLTCYFTSPFRRPRSSPSSSSPRTASKSTRSGNNTHPGGIFLISFRADAIRALIGDGSPVPESSPTTTHAEGPHGGASHVPRAHMRRSHVRGEPTGIELTVRVLTDCFTAHFCRLPRLLLRAHRHRRRVRVQSRSIPPPWRSIRFRLAPRTYRGPRGGALYVW